MIFAELGRSAPFVTLAAQQGDSGLLGRPGARTVVGHTITGVVSPSGFAFTRRPAGTSSSGSTVPSLIPSGRGGRFFD
jgi:hypothetical protein